MKIIIKFMGTAGDDFIRQNHSEKIEIELSDNAVVKNIFDYFNIPKEKEYSAIINSRIAKNSDALTDGIVVSIVQASYGG